MSRTIHEQLHVRLLSLPFHAFEGCLCDLLSAMGYEGVTLLGRTQPRQFTRHGGRDMEAYTHTGVTRARLVLQAKQYRRPVSRRFIDELRGTVLRLGARQGLLITTSTFSAVARKAAETSVAPIQLLDGETLVRLMIQYRIGLAVSPCLDGQNECVNEAYFTRLRERFPDRPATEPSPPRATLRVSMSSPPIKATLAVPMPYPLRGGTLLWRTHVFAGVNTLWLLKLAPGVLTPETFPVLTALAAFGALLPDLDASESKIRSLSIGGIRPFAPVSVLAHRTFGHRGFLHSPGALVLLALPPEDVMTLLWMLIFTTPNGDCVPSVIEIAQAMQVSESHAQERLKRLVQFHWQGQPLALALHAESGLDRYAPCPHIVAFIERPPTLAYSPTALKPIAWAGRLSSPTPAPTMAVPVPRWKCWSPNRWAGKRKQRRRTHRNAPSGK